MRITYGDGAADRFRTTIQEIPAGYILAIETTTDAVDDCDVQLVHADADAIHVRPVEDDTDRPIAPTADPVRIPWVDVAAVHIY